MTKRKRIFMLVSLFPVLFLSFFVPSLAASDEVFSETDESGAISDIIKEFSSLIPEESGVVLNEDELIAGVGIDGMFGALLGSVMYEKSRIISFFLSVMGFALFAVLCDSVSFSGSGMEKHASVGVFVIMSVTVYPTVYSVFSEVRTSLEGVSSFFGAALPILTAISAASGSVKTAGVQAMNMNITLGIIGSVASRLLLPLSFALLALALTSSISDGISVGVGKGIKSLFTFGLGIVTAASSAAIALQSVVAGAADSAALRAARYAAGGLIPVVGSSVSGALSTLAGGLAYAKSTVGAASIGVISVLSITPLILLLIYRMVFSLGITLMEYMDNGRCVRCFSAYRTAMDAVISVYVMSTLVCIIQVILFIKGGVI